MVGHEEGRGAGGQDMERLSAQSFFSLHKTRLWGELITVYNYVMGGCAEAEMHFPWRSTGRGQETTDTR